MTSDEALALARSIAHEQGWTWKEPIRVTKRRPWLIGNTYWEVVSNANSRGMNVRVSIEDRTGKVRRKVFLPR